MGECPKGMELDWWKMVVVAWLHLMEPTCNNILENSPITDFVIICQHTPLASLPHFHLQYYVYTFLTSYRGHTSFSQNLPSFIPTGREKILSTPFSFLPFSSITKPKKHPKDPLQIFQIDPRSQKINSNRDKRKERKEKQ